MDIGPWSRTPAKSVEDWVLPEGGEQVPFADFWLLMSVCMTAVMLFFTKEGAKRFDEKQKM